MRLGFLFALLVLTISSLGENWSWVTWVKKKQKTCCTGLCSWNEHKLALQLSLRSLNKWLLIFLFYKYHVAAHHCVWYGECGNAPVPGKKYNCNYTGPPKPLPPDGYLLLTVRTALWCFFFGGGVSSLIAHIFWHLKHPTGFLLQKSSYKVLSFSLCLNMKELCPGYDYGNKSLCCNVDQLRTLKGSLQLPLQFLSRYAKMLYNKLPEHMTCLTWHRCSLFKKFLMINSAVAHSILTVFHVSSVNVAFSS